ncbi:MAG: hypothetical protein WC707_01225 [Candidatus Babeliaceae bacterium]|jgi:hypothetical protein
MKRKILLIIFAFINYIPATIQATDAHCACGDGKEFEQKNVYGTDEAAAICNILCVRDAGVSRSEMR